MFSWYNLRLYFESYADIFKLTIESFFFNDFLDLFVLFVLIFVYVFFYYKKASLVLRTDFPYFSFSFYWKHISFYLLLICSIFELRFIFLLTEVYLWLFWVDFEPCLSEFLEKIEFLIQDSVTVEEAALRSIYLSI